MRDVRSSSARAAFLLTIVFVVLTNFGVSGHATSTTTGAGPGDPQASQDRRTDPDVAAIVKQVLTSAEHPGLTWSAIPDVTPDLQPLYDAEPDGLLWFEGTTPVAAVERTVRTLGTAGDHGLDAADYDATALAAQWAAIKAGRVSQADRALFDLGLSVASARLLRAVHIGRVDPATMQWGYQVERKVVDQHELLREAREGPGLAAMLERLQPPFPHYARARKALAHYKLLAQAGEPALVPALPKGTLKLEIGKSWDGVPMLAARLRTLGDLAASPGGDAIYSAALVDAVKRFQGRHGLDVDGVVGAGTIRAINVPLRSRIRQIELSMERMRWLPDLGSRPNVFVNIPLFRLWATDPNSGEDILRMNVVVGKSLNHQTPLFVEQMEYVIFRPYWNPPRSIVIKELIPNARKDPSYLDREQLEIVASGEDSAAALPATSENMDAVIAGKLYIRQKPGPKNSLGLAKFIFPNAENVYMHGTPAQQLFARARRDFSHGCIRLEDPARFGEWVLRDSPDWTRTRIDAAMQGQRPTRVNLKEKLTVVLFYDTVLVNSEGLVFFVEDIYGDDSALDTALDRGYPYPVKG